MRALHRPPAATWIGAAPARGDLAGHPVSEPAPLRMPDNLIAAKQAPAHRVGDRAGRSRAGDRGTPIRSPPGRADACWLVRRLGHVHGWIGGTHDRIGSET